MEIKQLQHAHGISFFLTGRIDSFTAPLFEKKLKESQQAGTYRFFINFKDVTFINSTALGMLIEILNTNQANKGNLYIYNIPANIMRIFRITKLNEVFPIYADADDVAEKLSIDLPVA